MQTSSLEIEVVDSRKHMHTVFTSKILRSIKNKRTVFDGTYDGQIVIIKRFEDIFCRYHASKEKYGLERLKDRCLSMPEVLLYGKDKEGNCILILQKIKNARDILDVISSSDEVKNAKAILLKLFHYVAQMHQAGVIQNDLHTGNFLIADKKIYAIDTACMEFKKKPISLARSYRQLAILLLSLPKKYRIWDKEFLLAYCDIRGIKFTEKMLEDIHFLMEKRWKKRLPHLLRKTLRNSKNFFLLKYQSYLCAFYKEAFDMESGKKAVETILSLSIEENKEHILDLCGCQYRLIPYTPRNWIHALSWRLIGSPLRQAWFSSWTESYLKGTQPKTFALIEDTNIFPKTGWLLTGY